MRIPIFTTIVITLVFLSGCGGGGSSNSSGSSEEFHLGAAVDNVALTADVSTTLTFTVPKPDDPYTEITIDIGRTLEEANITVTPQ